MAVKSRIPQGRSTKLQGCVGTSRLPQYSLNRPKSSSLLPPGGKTLDNRNKPLGNPPDNYKLAFIKPADVGHSVDLNANDGDDDNETIVTSADDVVNGNISTNNTVNNFEKLSGNSPQEDNCEILSLCSVDPSPLKASVEETPLDLISAAINNYPTELRLVTSGLHHTDPPLYIQQQSVDLQHSETSSTCSSVTDLRRSKVSSKTKLSLSKRNKSKQTSTEAPPAVSLAADCAIRPNDKTSRISQSRAAARQKKIPLPPKTSTKISASNAMDYVKRITSQGDDESPPSLPNNRMYSSTSRAPINDSSKPRKFSSTAGTKQNRRGNGKWSKDLDSAMNLNNVPNKMSFTGEVSSSSSIRAERKKMYQESKILSKLNEAGSSDRETPVAGEETRDITVLNGVTFPGSKQATGGLSKHGSPRIARPVMRPPRQRTKQPQQKQEEDEDPPEEVVAQEDEPNEETDYVSKMTRRASVPASPEKVMSNPRSRQRRRASEAIHLHQHLISDISEETTMESAGDSLASDIARRKDRWRTNDRYRDILENPNVVNFGQWRVKREGNYAPEEKYGVTERQRIRSSTDSDSVSPVRKAPDLSFTEQGNTDDDITQGNDVKSHAGFKSDIDQKSRSSTLDSSIVDSDDPSLGEIDDLPSLNSTAIDYSMCSTEPNTSLVQERRAFKFSQTLTPDRPSAVPENLRNGVASHGEVDKNVTEVTKRSEFTGSNVECPALHSSPLRNRIASDDIIKFNETASSGGDLATKLEEMSKEYQTVRMTLEELYRYLRSEEEAKSKMTSENERLRNKNDLLNEEVNRLTRIMEMKQSSPAKFHSSIRHSSMRDATSQTDDPTKVWYKTQLSSAKDELVDTLEQFNELLRKREDFDHSVDATKRKLFGLLEGISQN